MELPVSTADVVAVIPAAGAGLRMPGAEAKQFRELGGMSVLARTVRAVASAPSVGHVIVAAPAAALDRAAAEVVQAGESVSVVRGGASRHESVGLGLDAVPAGAAVVVVHDGVRPFVTEREIEEVVAAAREVGGGIAASAPVETVKEMDGGSVARTVDRNRIRLAQTPQAFRAEILRAAYDRARAEGYEGTDEASLVEKLGEKIAIIEADPWNRKITTEDDYRIGEWLLREGIRP